MNTADYNGRKLVLCEDQTPGFSTRITAEVKDGCFIITGKDEGAAVSISVTEKTQKSSLPCWPAEAGILWNRWGGTFTVWTARVAFVNSAMKIR